MGRPKALPTKRQIEEHKARAIKRWRDRRRRISFVDKRRDAILALSTNGWPRMTHNADYPKWLDIVYLAKSRGLYSLKTSNCDVIMMLRHIALGSKPKK